MKRQRIGITAATAWPSGVRLRFPGGGQYRPQIMRAQREDAPGSIEQTLQGVASQPFSRFFVEASTRFLGRPARPVADMVVSGGNSGGRDCTHHSSYADAWTD